jgi:hypothetical protein
MVVTKTTGTMDAKRVLFSVFSKQDNRVEVRAARGSGKRYLDKGSSAPKHSSPLSP